MKILHPCRVPFQILQPGDQWSCDICHQRWKCEYCRGGKRVKRVSLFRWAWGLD